MPRVTQRLYPQRHAQQRFAAPDFAQVHRELKKKGLTLQLLWEEYRQAAQGVPYSRSRFCERYLAFVGTLRRSMRQTHVAGEKLFVDFAGPTLPLYGARPGEESRAHIFVAVWGASNTPTWKPPRPRRRPTGSARTSTRSPSSAGRRRCSYPISRELIR